MASENTIFDKFLRENITPKGEKIHTHTRLGDVSKNLYPGSYCIKPEAYKQFLELYHKNVFINKNMEYLTERQSIEDGPILVDIDFRYDKKIKEKQHSPEHITDLVVFYMETISKMFKIPENTSIRVIVLEKPNVNMLEDKTKDGIHIIICIKMHKALQVILREKIVSEIKGMWDDLPIKNTWEDVFDLGVTKGLCNWQLIGSRKPGHEAYELKYLIKMTYTEKNNVWAYKNESIVNAINAHTIETFSARYTAHPSFAMNPDLESAYNDTIKTLSKLDNNVKNKPLGVHNKMNIDGHIGRGVFDYGDIDCEDTLNETIARITDGLSTQDYLIKEIHEYTLALPVQYYGEGSYSKWIQVGWALANTDVRLFPTWIKLSCQSAGFDWKGIKKLLNDWYKFEVGIGSLTYRSIIFWCKTDAPEKYQEIRTKTIDYFVEETLKAPSDFDLANVLYNMCKDDFVCVSIKNNIWYECNNKNFRWTDIDSGTTLRGILSGPMHKIYNLKAQANVKTLASYDMNDPRVVTLTKTNNRLAEICGKLKNATSKNNIMREAKELFFDKGFLERLDQNPYLMCFNNCVVDFKNKCHREGRPDDYLTKCTNIDYTKFGENTDKKIISDITEFMCQLFPVKELNEYMWNHLASILIGINLDQRFHIYKGSGRNGKSKLVELMGKSMGTYKATVPITLITSKRNTIGSTSSEVAALVGVRCAVMQEMSAGEKMNEGIMKELTGGDDVVARSLFKDSITFKPQFKLIGLTNVDFDEIANDDGTWRRMRYIPFDAKFLEDPYNDPVFPKSECPYQYLLDKNLSDKFDEWAPIWMSMLVERAYSNQGIVPDCKTVLDNSNKHRDKSDYIAEFEKDKIQKVKGGRIKKTELYETFKEWFKFTQGKLKIPKQTEIVDYMERKYGVLVNKCWHNVSIIYGDGDVEGEEES